VVDEAAISAAMLLLGEQYSSLVRVVGQDLALLGVRGALSRALATTLDTAESAADAIRAMNTPAWEPLIALLAIYAADPPPGSALTIGPDRKRQIHDRLALARSGCAWWALDGLAVIAEAPSTLQLDEAGRLRSETGPAMAYADGSAVWMWHGVEVPRFAIEAPEQITAHTILSESNQEVRRVLVARMGSERLVKETGARPISQDSSGTLWEIPESITGVPGSRHALRVVEFVNITPEPDGTHRHYFLRVPPHLRSAHDAVAWTFNLEGREYDPAIES
jgi:hypothetical protein